MADRLTRASARRDGAALGALLAIVVITVAWWALALWPSDSATPEWLERTRAACFGSPPGGLPNAGGWILLIGQPLGMVAVLLAVWGDALRADMRRWSTSTVGRSALVALPIVVLAGLTLAGRQVAAIERRGAPLPVEPSGVLTSASTDLSGLVLTDQHGKRRALEELARQPALLTVAFAHCETVCPTIVRDLLRVRDASTQREVAIIVITVDPWRDTPARLSSIASDWGLAPPDLVLSGTVTEVERVLDRLEIARARDLRTGDVVHGTVVFRLNDGGLETRLEGGWGSASELLTHRRM